MTGTCLIAAQALTYQACEKPCAVRLATDYRTVGVPEQGCMAVQSRFCN